MNHLVVEGALPTCKSEQPVKGRLLASWSEGRCFEYYFSDRRSICRKIRIANLRLLLIRTLLSTQIFFVVVAVAWSGCGFSVSSFEEVFNLMSSSIQTTVHLLH